MIERLKTTVAAATLIAALAFGVFACLRVPDSAAHFVRCHPEQRTPAQMIECRKHNVYHASLSVFCGSAYRPCYEGVKAYVVARCETGGTFDKWARNGQYHGLWQIGYDERRQCRALNLLGRDPWTQARAAKCWRSKHPRGWGGWSCG